MNFSKTTEYSIRILILMATEKDKIFSAQFLNKKLGIPYKYLTNLLKRLSDLGFISSSRGRRGGYKLLKELKDVSIYQIIGAIEGFEIFTKCILGFMKCNESNPCPMHNEWSKVREHSISVLKKMTLFELKNLENCRI